jgi:hypothetical protein
VALALFFVRLLNNPGLAKPLDQPLCEICPALVWEAAVLPEGDLSPLKTTPRQLRSVLSREGKGLQKGTIDLVEHLIGGTFC